MSPPTSAVTMRAFASETLARALATACDRGRPTEERRLAATVAAHVLEPVPWDEECIVAVLGTVTDCLDAWVAVKPLIHAIASARLDPASLQAPLTRLARRAFERGFAGSLHALVSEMLAVNAWSEEVRGEWAAAALTWILGRPERAPSGAPMIVEPWVTRFGADHDWLRDAVESEPLLMRTRLMGVRVRRELHAAAPTVTGWHALARDPALRAAPPWTAAAFGSQADAAIETLQGAIGEEGDAGARLTLVHWLVELAGEA